MRFSIAIVGVMPDGTATATSVQVDSDRLLLDEYNDELYDNVATAFGTVVDRLLGKDTTKEATQ